MSTISAGTTLTTALVQTGDTTGNLVIKTGSSNTTAMTISGSDQSVTIVGTLTANGSSITPSQWTSNSTAIYYNTGNVGIGTSSPATQLQMNSGATTYSDQLRIRNTNYGNADIGVGNGIMALATDMTNIAFYTSSSLGTTGSSLPSNERMRIDSSGNVGIGTGSSIGAKLDVYASNGSVQRLSVYDGQGSNNFGTDYYITNTQQTISRIAANYVSSGNSGYGDLKFYTAAGSGLVERVKIGYAGELWFNSGYGSVAIAYGCRAWVKFTGTGTPGVSASGNVSSITDNGTGYYGVNFSTAMPDANYSVVGCIKPTTGQTGNNARAVNVHWNSGQQTSYVNVVTATSSAGYEDPEFVYIAVFR